MRMKHRRPGYQDASGKGCFAVSTEGRVLLDSNGHVPRRQRDGMSEYAQRIGRFRLRVVRLPVDRRKHSPIQWKDGHQLHRDFRKHESNRVLVPRWQEGQPAVRAPFRLRAVRIGHFRLILPDIPAGLPIAIQEEERLQVLP